MDRATPRITTLPGTHKAVDGDCDRQSVVDKIEFLANRSKNAKVSMVELVGSEGFDLG